MSLKDRLNTAQKQTAQTAQIKKEQPPKYYNTDKEAQIDSLGILDTLLADDDLNSVFVSGAKNIYLEKKGKISKSTTTYRDNVQLENIIKKIAQNMGVELNEDNPYFEFNYTQGVNVSTTLPPLSSVATMFVKNYKDKHANLQTLQTEQSVSKEIALVLEAFCTIKKNILIIGEKNTLKTTLLSALAKKIQTNNRAIIIDFENEFKILSQNHTNYNFSKFNDKAITFPLFNSIVESNPDKIFINCKDEDFIAHCIKKIKTNYKGAIMTLCASDSNDAISKLSQILIQNSSCLSLSEAKEIILNTFDIIITTKKDKLGKRIIASISEINLNSFNNAIKDIFEINYLNQHKSQGIIPLFYEDIKLNSLPISDNIFNQEYKHTYHKNQDSSSQYIKKEANIDVLKKFKKDLPTPEEENISTMQEKTIKETSEEALMQKAQEKFNELKKNAQTQNEFELKTEDFEEYDDENLQ